jgi:hypothetical protein
MKHRFIVAASASGRVPADGAPPITLNGTSYSAPTGSFCDVPMPAYSGGGGALVSPAYLDLGACGVSDDRPALYKADAGKTYIDTTLGSKVIVWDGAAWRDMTGTLV